MTTDCSYLPFEVPLTPSKLNHVSSSDSSISGMDGLSRTNFADILEVSRFLQINAGELPQRTDVEDSIFRANETEIQYVCQTLPTSAVSDAANVNSQKFLSSTTIAGRCEAKFKECSKNHSQEIRKEVNDENYERIVQSLNEISDDFLTSCDRSEDQEIRDEDLYQQQVRALQRISDEDLISFEEEKHERRMRALYAAFANGNKDLIRYLVAPNLLWSFDGPPCHEYMKELLTEPHTPFAGVFIPLRVKFIANCNQIFVEGQGPGRQTFWVHIWTIDPAQGSLVQLEEHWDTAIVVRDLSSYRPPARSVIWESVLAKKNMVPTRSDGASPLLIIDI